MAAAAVSPGRPAGPGAGASGTRQVTLLELFTSQGCSSCPPAERWLNEYVDAPALWREVVPVAEHVDYWDELGWKDPYATAANSARQRKYAQIGRTGTVYTPEFFSNGREWRGWVLRLPLRSSRREAGRLTATIVQGRIEASYPQQAGVLELHVALLGSGIRTRVVSGENRNRTLSQEFVVLAHTITPASNGSWRVPLPGTAVPATRYGIALWVSAADDPVPLQATGAWLADDAYGAATTLAR